MFQEADKDDILNENNYPPSAPSDKGKNNLITQLQEIGLDAEAIMLVLKPAYLEQYNQQHSSESALLESVFSKLQIEINNIVYPDNFIEIELLSLEQFVSQWYLSISNYYKIKKKINDKDVWVYYLIKKNEQIIYKYISDIQSIISLKKEEETIKINQTVAKNKQKPSYPKFNNNSNNSIKNFIPSIEFS